MKKVLRVDKFNSMVRSQLNPNFKNNIWIFDYKRGFVAFGDNGARYFETKKEAVNSDENLYF